MLASGYALRVLSLRGSVAIELPVVTVCRSPGGVNRASAYVPVGRHQPRNIIKRINPRERPGLWSPRSCLSPAFRVEPPPVSGAGSGMNKTVTYEKLRGCLFATRTNTSLRRCRPSPGWDPILRRSQQWGKQVHELVTHENLCRSCLSSTRFYPQGYPGGFYETFQPLPRCGHRLGCEPGFSAVRWGQTVGNRYVFGGAQKRLGPGAIVCD